MHSRDLVSIPGTTLATKEGVSVAFSLVLALASAAAESDNFNFLAGFGCFSARDRVALACF